MAKERSFEEALGELESCTARLESGELPLEEAIKAFEEGIKLAKQCRKKLDEAEGKILKLTEKGELEELPPMQG